MNFNYENIKIIKEWKDQYGRTFISLSADFIDKGKTHTVTFFKIPMYDLHFSFLIERLAESVFQKEGELNLKLLSTKENLLYEISPKWEIKEMTIEDIESILDCKIKIVSK